MVKLRFRRIGHGGEGRVGVVDIGSNSIRLVVYDKLGRAPKPIFNEKVLCGLGRNLALTGKLSPEGATMALDNLIRFARLLDGMGVTRVDALATAAVREAQDGPAFVTRVKAETGFPVRVIKGEEEARLSAMGVRSASPDAIGVMGDLGGGSLELVGLTPQGAAEHVTLPLGPFRLMADDAEEEARRALVDRTLAELPWLASYRGQTFYPVGGAWRAVARAHMARQAHPIHIIQDFTAETGALRETTALIAAPQAEARPELQAISRKRMEIMPAASLVLERLLAALEPRQVTFSAYGLREGHLFDLLPPERRDQDPLIAAATDVAERVDRYGFGSSHEIAAWTAGLYENETSRHATLRVAAGLLSDVGWATHPDYRADQAFQQVLTLPVVGVSHAERAFLAAAIHVRYGGALAQGSAALAARMLTAEEQRSAQILGLALRLAHTLTGGATSMLSRTRLLSDRQGVALALAPEDAVLAGDVVAKRLEAVGRALGRAVRIEKTTAAAA